MRTTLKVFATVILTIGLLTMPGAAVAAPLTGVSVTGSGGGGLWDPLAVTTDAIPAEFSLTGAGGQFPILLLTIDEDGLLTVTPHPQSCSINPCFWSTGTATFDFTLDAPAPPVFGLTPILTNPGLGVALSLVDDDTFASRREMAADEQISSSPQRNWSSRPHLCRNPGPSSCSPRAWRAQGCDGGG